MNKQWNRKKLSNKNQITNQVTFESAMAGISENVLTITDLRDVFENLKAQTCFHGTRLVKRWKVAGRETNIRDREN